MEYTFDIYTADAEAVFVQQGLFTGDDIAGLAGDGEDARAQAYVESLAEPGWPAGDLACRLWRQHVEPLALLATLPADLTWTLTDPDGAP